jgi:hypothetical protein
VTVARDSLIMTHKAHTIDLHGHVSAAFDLKASVTGTFDTGLIPLSTRTFESLFIP